MLKRFGILLAVFLLFGCAGGHVIEKPQVSLAGLQIEKLGLNEQTFLIVLRIDNPNSFPLSADGADFKLEIEGDNFAGGASQEPIALPGRGQAQVKLRVNTRLQLFKKHMRSIIQADKPLEYRLSGRLNVSWLPAGIPFERSGQLPSLKSQMLGSRDKSPG